MPKKKSIENYASLGEKDCWHLYGLQVLTPRKFAKVVGKVLAGKYTLVRPSASDRITA